MTSVSRSLVPQLDFVTPDPPTAPVNPLLKSQLFTRLSSNEVLTCSPSVVHFGGFQTGGVSTQILYVVNKGNKPVHYHIIPPLSVHFRAMCLSKKGALSPGKADEIMIEFEPTEYRYYYDTIKLHVEGDENLVVPIHAYPVTNGAQLPSRLDLGVCSVGERVTKKLPLRCNVPLDFEYEIRVIRPSDAIHVGPLSGILPAGNQVNIEVQFSPLRMVTEICEIELRLSEFNHKPVRCIITGSAQPGVVKERILKEHNAEDGADGDELKRAQDELKALKMGGGAGGGDGYTRMVDARKKANRTYSDRSYHMFHVRGDGQMIARSKVQLDDFDVDPAALRTQSVVQKVLVRREDKGDGTRGRASRLSDAASNAPIAQELSSGPSRLARTITGRSRTAQSEASHRIARDATFKTALTSETSDTRRGGEGGGRESAINTRTSGPGGFASISEFEGFVQQSFPTHVDDPLVNDNVKESVFRKGYARVTEYVRVKDIRNIPASGEELMTALDETRFMDERKELQQRAEEARRIEDAVRSKSILRANAAIRKVDVRPRGMEASATSPRSSPNPSPRRGLGSPSRMARESTSIGQEQEKLPSFVIYENNDWLKRMMALERFRVIARVILIRVRLKRRLEKLKAVLKAAKYQADKVDEVAREILQKGQAPKKPKKGEPAPHEFKLDPEKLRIGMLGVAWGADSGSSTGGVPLEVGNPQGYHQIDPLPLKVPLQYRLLGYSEEDLEHCTDYFPPLPEQPLLSGAPEEEAALLTVPVGEAEGVDVGLIRDPPSAIANPHDHVISALKIGTRYTEDLRNYPLNISWGLDERYRLQPRSMPSENKPMTETFGSNGVRAIMHSDLPMLADLPGWKPARRVTEWPFTGVATGHVVSIARMSGPDPADDLGGSQVGPDELGLAVDVEPQAPKTSELEEFLPESIFRNFSANTASASTSDFKSYWRRNPPPHREDLEEAKQKLPAEREYADWHDRLLAAKDKHREVKVARIEKANASVKKPGWSALNL